MIPMNNEAKSYGLVESHDNRMNIHIWGSGDYRS